MGQDRVVVRERVLEPVPVLAAVLLIVGDKTVGGQRELPLDIAGAGELPEIVAHAKDGVGHASDGLLQHVADGPVEAVFYNGEIRRGRRVGQDCAEGPEGPAETIMGGLILPPAPVEIHEIADRPVGVL